MHPGRHQGDQQRAGHHQGKEVILLRHRVGGENGVERVPLGGDDQGASGGQRHRRPERHQDEAEQQAPDHSVIAMARNAMRSRIESFSVALLSWPHAARMSLPRGVRTGEE